VRAFSSSVVRWPLVPLPGLPPLISPGLRPQLGQGPRRAFGRDGDGHGLLADQRHGGEIRDGIEPLPREEGGVGAVRGDADLPQGRAVRRAARQRLHPMLPPAPPRLSMTRYGAPGTSFSTGTSSRATVSAPPPGGKGTM
jgi:hypothetical protein